ncbi:MAG: TM0106 family RecB-like putative nuclease [Chloroflexi bacterium]|nr:TM0106 family RecB-like putative nuclease [Chloroflexota bacterium]
MPQAVITAYTLRALTICPRRVWLDHNGDTQMAVEAASDLSYRGLEHERAISAAMFGPAQPVLAASWPEAAAATQALMQRGVPGIQGAALESTVTFLQPVAVRGRVDWLRRVSQPSQLGRWSYEPIEIKHRLQLSDEDKLQLDLYIWLLQNAQGSTPSGWFWLGRDEAGGPAHQIEHEYQPERLFTVLQQAAGMLQAAEAPPIFLASHCQLCRWRAACEQTASASQDITLLPGLSRITWEHLHHEGIQTLNQILDIPPESLRRIKGIGQARAQEFHIFAQAVVSSRPVQRHPLPETLRQPSIMFDLETRLDNGLPWCFGWQVDGQAATAAIVDPYCQDDQLALPDGTRVIVVADSDQGWQLIAETAREHPGLILHWGSFEMGVLRQTAPPDVVAALQSRLHDLNKTFKKTCVLPVRGTSIKKVAPYLGFHWPPGATALSAWADYNAWLKDNDRDALARACAYNRADVEALTVIWRWLTAL